MITEQSESILPFLISQGFSPTILERFWTKVEKTSHCWIWTGATMRNGYGRISKRGHAGFVEYAHRVSWIIHFGAIPDGMLVCHNCPGGMDHPWCVNPSHLFLGSPAENSQDMENKCRTGITAKLTPLMVKKIRFYRETFSGAELATFYGVSQATISMIKHQKIWRNATRLGRVPVI